MKKLIMVIMVGLLILPVAANAGSFQAKDRTFTLSGSGESENDFDNAVISMQASVGYFIKDNIEIAFRQGLSFSDSGDGETDWAGSSRIAADRYMDDLGLKGILEPLTAFVGVNFGYRYGDEIDSDFIACPEVGLKYFISDTTFITTMVEYEILLETDYDEWDDAFSDGRFIYTIGMGLRF
ncbi:hypothetical protein [Desulfonema magnum]|uniref:Outer membrane protein beta-barrel domain-containing protein n=1 Tax=Desulfonema magnum TaxID=45655 RepID=A0A975GPU8_9BACT|nr:hypothetical protein [Desulfonema magnum]QTA89190.1 Uncharacterized protein dnm_052400 [Desulfonema magnum]